MIRKIGRFSAYLPDKDLFQTLLGILSLSSFTRGGEFDAPLHKMHCFFYEMKKAYPSLFEDVFFKHDPDFPYSDEIADVFIRLQESEFVTRPNPSLNCYRMDADLTEKRPIPASDDYEAIKEMAEKFSQKFKIANESVCRF